MSTMTSVWQTGTYDLLVWPDSEGEPGDLMVVVFAAPTDLNNHDADDDAPILAHIDVMKEECDWTPEKNHLGLHSIGEHGLLTPENVCSIYGDKLGVRILLALYQAAERDFRGMDMDAMPWRTPSSEAFPMMRRAHDMMMVVKERLGM